MKIEFKIDEFLKETNLSEIEKNNFKSELNLINDLINRASCYFGENFSVYQMANFIKIYIMNNNIKFKHLIINQSDSLVNGLTRYLIVSGFEKGLASRVSSIIKAPTTNYFFKLKEELETKGVVL